MGTTTKFILDLRFWTTDKSDDARKSKETSLKLPPECVCYMRQNFISQSHQKVIEQETNAFKD